jgi:hypothetical protein
MNETDHSKYCLYFPREAGQVMLRQKITQPAAGKDVHRVFGEELRLSHLQLWLTAVVP